jgi:hypothetical protein
MVKRFQFGPVFFLSVPSFTSQESCFDNNPLVEPATDIYWDIVAAKHLPLHGIEQFSRLADPFSDICRVTASLPKSPVLTTIP